MEKTFKYILVTAGAIEGFLFGSTTNINKSLLALVIIMGFNIVTAMLQKNTNSKDILYIVKLCVINLIFISFTHFIQLYMGLDIEVVTISAFIMAEGYSVVENFIKLGVPVPDKIKEIFVTGGAVNGK